MRKKSRDCSTILFALWGWVFILGLAGCCSTDTPEGPVSLPSDLLRTDAFVGGPVSGPTPSPLPESDMESGAFLRLRLAGAGKEEGFEQSESIGPRTRIVLTPEASHPFQPVSRLGREIRLGRKQLQADWSQAADSVVFPGTTSRFEMAHSPTRGSALLLHRPEANGGRLIPAIEVWRDEEREVIVLEGGPLKEWDGTTFYLPWEDGFLSARLTVRDAPDQGSEDYDAYVEAHAKTLPNLLDAREVVEVTGRRGTIELAPVRRALQEKDRRRQALTGLARSLGASLTEMLSRSVDPELLDRLAERVGELLGESNERERLGWRLEKASIEVVENLLLARETGPRLTGVLLRYAGAAGAQPETLVGLAHLSRNRAEFRRRIARENQAALRSDRLTERVRAYDWLRARGAVPDGYDPFASEAERLQALTAAEKDAERNGEEP